MPADRQLRQPWVCLFHGDDAGVQRSRRYDYSHGCELLRFLAARNSPGVRSGEAARDEVEWSFLLDYHRGISHGCGQCVPVQAGKMEAAENLKQIFWGGRNGFEPSSPRWSPGALPWLCYSRVLKSMAAE